MPTTSTATALLNIYYLLHFRGLTLEYLCREGIQEVNQMEGRVLD